MANYAAYVQDRWHPTSGLTISAGLRWEKSKHRTLGRGNLPASLEIFDKNIRSEIEVDDAAFAPRVGVAYNLGKGAGVVRGSAGRFHERIGTGDYNNYPEGLGFNTWRIPTTSFGSGIEALTLFTSGTIPVNPDFNRNMKIEYNDEATLGYERRLPWNLAVDVTYIWRKINVSESRDANVIFYPNGTFARIDPNFDRANYREFLTGDDRIELSFDAFNLFNWAAYTGFLSSDVRRPDRYPVEVNPQRPRAMQANVRYVF